MFIEPMITSVPSGFSGYIWLDTKILLKKMPDQLFPIFLLPNHVYMLSITICLVSLTSRWLSFIIFFTSFACHIEI